MFLVFSYAIGRQCMAMLCNHCLGLTDTCYRHGTGTISIVTWGIYS